MLNRCFPAKLQSLACMQAKARRKDEDQGAGPGSLGDDADGDTEMRQARGPRGGKRVRRRKMRMEADGQGGTTVCEDVEMDDVSVRRAA